MQIHRGRAHRWLAAACVATSLLAFSTAVSAQTSGPDLTITQAQYPDDDAVILRWEQSWTLNADGTLRRRDHQWVRLFNQRAIRAFADPRIDYAAEHDTLTIHKAQTILPDGTTVAVPEYSFNDTGPTDTAGWPQYAAWRQQVVSFSAIESGAVVELDYEVASPPGSWPWLEADLRLNEDYPTAQRIITVTVPDSITLQHQLDGVKAGSNSPQQTKDGGRSVYRWTFERLASDRAEAQSPPWQERGGRLRFTTCKSMKEWAGTFLKPVERSAQINDAVRSFAAEATKDEPNRSEQIRKLSKKLRDTFTVVNSPKALNGLACRDAADVLDTSYGNPLEAAALLAAAVRSLGMEATLRVAADATTWKDTVPTESALAGVVVVADCEGRKIVVHPEHGVVSTPGSWGRKLLFDLDDTGAVRKSYVEARGEATASDIEVAGKITVSSDHKASGELRFTLTGAFYDPAKLDTADAQKAHVAKLVGRVVSGFEVSGHSVATLSDDVFRVTAQVASKEPLEHTGPVHILSLGDGPAFLDAFPMPLSRSYRRTDVRLNGRFRERCDVVIELPKKYECVVSPPQVRTADSAWGAVHQETERTENELRIRRRIEVNMETLSPESFAPLRDAVNDLRGGVEAYRTKSAVDERVSAAAGAP